MPLLAKKIFSCSKPPTDIKQDESIYVIPHTREQFRSKEYPFCAKIQYGGAHWTQFISILIKFQKF